MSSPVPFLCVVYPTGGHAGSAGAILMQACHVNGAVEATNIGAASPVTGTGQEMPEDLRKKIFEDKFNDAYSEFKNILINSINIRTRSDVPIGCFLSGGLDSSVIAIVLRKFLNTNATFFTAAFEDGDFDESYQARGLSKMLGLEHKDILVSSKDCLNIINDIPG